MRALIDLIKETAVNAEKAAGILQDISKCIPQNIGSGRAEKTAERSGNARESGRSTEKTAPETEKDGSIPALPDKFESPSPSEFGSGSFAPSLRFDRYWRLNYSLLEDREKKAYEAIETAVLRGFPSTRVDLPADTDLIIKVAKSLILDNWSLFYINTAMTVVTDPEGVYVCFHYNRFNDDREGYLRKMKETAERVYETRVRKCATPYEAELAIHDYLTETVKYDKSDDELAHSPVGPLLYGRGVCEGISEAFAFLACSCGIKASMMAGTQNRGSHRWNIVEIEGERYHLDVTDDLSGLHSYFNCDDAMLRKDHAFPKSVGCCHTRQNYYSVNGSRFRLASEASGFIKEQSSKGRGTSFEFMVENGVNPSEVLRIARAGAGQTPKISAVNSGQRSYRVDIS